MLSELQLYLQSHAAVRLTAVTFRLWEDTLEDHVPTKTHNWPEEDLKLSADIRQRLDQALP